MFALLPGFREKGFFVCWEFYLEMQKRVVRVCLCNRYEVWFQFQSSSRRLALGWPLALSQEEHLSYCVGSPLAPAGLEISLIRVSFIRSASIVSCRLVGISLPGTSFGKIARICLWNCCDVLFVLHVNSRRLALGWRLSDFIELSLSKQICFFYSVAG